MSKDVEFLIKVVKEAEKIVSNNFNIDAKGGENDLVTDLDVKIEKYIINEIKKEYPEFDIVSEEENSKKEVSENCFIIDPIDGTINFANGLPLWGIQIACVKNGETIASVINMPDINELYYADNTGAYLNGKRIYVKEVPIKNTLYTIDASDIYASVDKMRKSTPGIRKFGGVCVSLAFLSAGRIHGAVYRKDKPWDYEPGLFLVKMAGGAVSSKPGFHGAAMNEELLNILEVQTSKKSTNSNIFVLHSLNADTLEYWGKNLKSFFLEKDITVRMPNFPIRSESSYENFNEILSTYLEDGQLNENSIVICHSISNPYFVRFCKEHNYKPKHYIAVAPKLIYKYPFDRNDYFVNVANAAYLKQDALDYGKNFNSVYCFYSDEDDGNIEEFHRFVKDFNAKDCYLKGYNHFDGYHRIYEIPELVELVDKLI